MKTHGWIVSRVLALFMRSSFIGIENLFENIFRFLSSSFSANETLIIGGYIPFLLKQQFIRLLILVCLMKNCSGNYMRIKSWQAFRLTLNQGGLVFFTINYPIIHRCGDI